MKISMSFISQKEKKIKNLKSLKFSTTQYEMALRCHN